MRVSVLICTYNRARLLQKALVALIDHTTEKPDEIIIINGGTDEATQVVNRFNDKHGIQLKLISTENINLATSRNIGLAACTGDIVAMTDDDAEVFPDWISQIKRLHSEHPEAGGIGGSVIGAQSADNFLSRLSDIVTFPLPNEPTYVRTVPGVNVSYKREVLGQVGEQDVTLFRGEDVDFNWRIKQLGYEIYFHPALKVLHYHRPSLWGFFHQHTMYGRAYYLVRRKWPEMYCVYPHQFKRPKDFLKAIYFWVAIIYQPILDLRKLNCWTDRSRALPILMLNHALWKFGMLWQAMLERRRPVEDRAHHPRP